jgi:polar amino acid transport system substrate-binding protein
MGRVRAHAVLVWLLVNGCGPFPDDPEQTTARVERTRVLRVGVTEHPPYVVRESQGALKGSEVALLTRFAAERGLHVTWVWGQQEALFHALERYELDIVIGGIHEQTPWSDRLALTRPYRKRPSPLVFALPPGENRWLYEIEQFLSRVGSLREERAP